MSSFEFDGEKYKQAPKHQKEWGTALIDNLKLEENAIILDLGCGDGVLTEKLASMVPCGEVIGIDASAGMIETAKELENDNLTFIKMDINEIEYDHKFDVIYSNAALHWVKDHGRLLNNCCKALKAGGVIAWNFAGDGTCSNFFEVVNTVMKEEAFQKYFVDFQWPWFMPELPEYEKLIEKVGFKATGVAYENADRYFSDRHEMIKWIDQPSIVPFIRHIPLP